MCKYCTVSNNAARSHFGSADHSYGHHLELNLSHCGPFDSSCLDSKAHQRVTRRVVVPSLTFRLCPSLVKGKFVLCTLVQLSQRVGFLKSSCSLLFTLNTLEEKLISFGRRCAAFQIFFQDLGLNHLPVGSDALLKGSWSYLHIPGDFPGRNLFSISELVCVEGLCSFWSSCVLNDNHSNLVSFPGRSDFL